MTQDGIPRPGPDDEVDPEEAARKLERKLETS